MPDRAAPPPAWWEVTWTAGFAGGGSRGYREVVEAGSTPTAIRQGGMAALDRIRAEGLTGRAVIAELGEPRLLSPAEAAAARRRTGRTAP